MMSDDITPSTQARLRSRKHLSEHVEKKPGVVKTPQKHKYQKPVPPSPSLENEKKSYPLPTLICQASDYPICFPHLISTALMKVIITRRHHGNDKKTKQKWKGIKEKAHQLCLNFVLMKKMKRKYTYHQNKSKWQTLNIYYQ